MVVQIVKFERPHLWLSLKAGGSLTIGQAYFFMGIFTQGSGYYGMACSRASEEKSITPTAGNQTINVEWYKDGGAYTAVADAGGGDITVTATAHGRDNGDTVYLRGGAYDGTYTISNVTTNTFDVTVAFSATDTGEWFADAGLPTLAHRIGFKWDKYTMINAVDGEPYQWLNLNDPVNAAKSEFDDGYGHRRWTMRYYGRDDGKSGTNGDYTQEATVYGSDPNYLYDGIAIGNTRYGNRGMPIPDIAFRDHDSYYRLPAGYSKINGKLLIYFDDAQAYNEDDLINALEASGFTDMFTLSLPNNDSGYNDYAQNLIVLGHIVVKSSASIDVEIKSINLTLLLNGNTYRFGSAGTFKYTRCNLIYTCGSNSFWVNNSHISYEDTSLYVLGISILDNISSAINFAPSGEMNFYSKTPSGFKMIGNPEQGSSYFQWRYQRENADSHMSDFYIKNFYIYLVNDDDTPDTTGKMTDVEFVNNGLKDYEVLNTWSYCVVACNKIMECKNVTCDRADGKILVNHNSSAQTITDIWNMRFGIDLTIVDENGTVINGADVELSWSGGSDTDTTDVNGVAEVVGLSYTIEWDNTMGAGIVTPGAYKEQTLIIKKAGYKTYKTKFTFQEGKTWTIALQKVLNLNFSKRVQINNY